MGIHMWERDDKLKRVKTVSDTIFPGNASIKSAFPLAGVAQTPALFPCTGGWGADRCVG